MGIKGLFKLLEAEAPECYKNTKKKMYESKKIAIDASVCLYQFLVQVRITDGSGYSSQLTNSKGEVTSHLQGFFNRTALLMESGIKPVFVFDGKPPEMKSGELQKRMKAKNKAREDLENANKKLEEATNEAETEEAFEEINTYSKRTVRPTRAQNEEAKHLLRLLGIPVVEAPCEAEAQCAELAKKGKVYAVSTEDMDALTFSTPVLLKKMTASGNETITEINYEKMLKGLNLTKEQFVDLCILCGCDYCESVPGIGPKTALKLIRKHGSIEEIAKHTKKDMTVMLEKVQEVRNMFTEPDVTSADEIKIKFGEPDRKEIIEFLVNKKGFNEERVNKVLDRIENSSKNKTQPKIDSFFKKKG